MKTAFWLFLAAMAAIYAVMLLWTLPTITAEADGLTPFDLRPLGYSIDEARAFLAALSDEGRALYLDTQLRLDTVYPVLLMVTLVLATSLLTSPGWLRWLLVAPAVLGMVFDLLENHVTRQMLRAGAGGLTEQLVEQGSRWSILKSGFTTISMTAVLVLLASHFLARRRA